MKEKKVILKLRGVTKEFEEGQVLKSTDLDIYEGEFVTLLGPSGCGKTTTLRISAGVEDATTGQVLIEEQDVTSLPPYKRNVNTVFQNYALFPHMNIFKNVSYSLVEKKISKKEIKERVTKLLEMVQLGKMEGRMPNQLSGGQKQRVAIARALANEPKILLLDEPLAALDLKLRQTMQLELKTLQKSLGITFVFVTHDQEEALTMSDRIVVMNKGNLEQIGTPKEIYEQPKTKFVADFIGESNIFEASVVANEEETLTLMMENGHVKANGTGFKNEEIVYICVRPENVRITKEIVEGFTLKGFVADQIYAGSVMRTIIHLPNGDVVKVNTHPMETPLEIGSLVNISWDVDKAVIMHTTEDTVYDAIEFGLLNSQGGLEINEK